MAPGASLTKRHMPPATQVDRGVGRGVQRAVLAWIDAFLLKRPLEARERFQARFLVGACFLALIVGGLNLFASVAVGLRLEAVLTLGLVLSVALQLGTFVLGAPVSTSVWTLLATLASYLTAVPLTTLELHPEKLFWLVMIPLSALVLVGPRGDGDAPARWARRAPLAFAVVALVLGLLIIAARHAGFMLAGASEEPPFFVAVNFSLFILATSGTAFLYDLSVRETESELSQLRRALSMCRWCRKVRDVDAWVPLEQYLAEHQQRHLDHEMCPSCFERTFPVVAGQTRPPRV